MGKKKKKKKKNFGSDDLKGFLNILRFKERK